MNTTYLKKILLAVYLIAITQSVVAQGSITGKLQDSSSKENLYLATITVFKAKDTSLITYRLSGEDGVFKMGGLPLNIPCRAVVSFSGYKTYRKEFTIKENNETLDLGTLLMQKDTANMEEVVVIAERPPMRVMRDTIEFNAASFRTLPNALVEDLLKKLPGVQVDKNGNITVNGKPVNRILVDGKAFFGNDPKMATRNLPSNVIDKVQVTDDKDELLRNGDDNINNIGKVINLTFKKGVKKGWFGKAYAGGGSQDRYEAGAIANIFRDTLQVSLLGYTNNLNRPGFSMNDLMQTGGMQRSSSVGGSRSISNWSDGSGGVGIRINDINFGGITEYGGLSTSSGVGININHSPNNNKSIFGQYFYGNIKVDALRNGYTEYNNKDTILRRTQGEKGDVVINAHSMGIGANINPDTLSNFIAGINYMFGDTDNKNVSALGATQTYTGLLSEGSVGLFRNNISKNYSHNLNYNRRSAVKKGRRFNVNHNLRWQLRDNDAITNSLIFYYHPVANDSAFSQLRKENIPTLNASVSANYNEPIIKNLSARADVRYVYEQLNNTIETYSNQGGSFTKPETALSNEFKRRSNSFSGSLGMEYRKDRFTVTPRLRYQSQKFVNRLVSMPNDVVQQINNFLPELGIVINNLNINYAKEVVLPDYSYLIPVFDNTNPYIINNGNPYLLPAVRHSINVNINHYDPKRLMNIWGWARAATGKNDVIQNIVLQPNGTQLIQPMNANRSHEISGNAGINKDYKFSQKFTMSGNFGFYYQYRQNPFSFNNLVSRQNSHSASLWGGFNLNFNDVFEINNNGYFGLEDVKNSNKDAFKSYSVKTYGITSEQVLRWPKHVIFENNISYNYNGAFVYKELRDYIRWNVAVNFTMFKNERGVLRLSAYDILKQVNNIGINVSQNMFSYNSSNFLGQYFMATFTYNILAMGAKKKVGGNSLFNF